MLKSKLILSVLALLALAVSSPAHADDKAPAKGAAAPDKAAPAPVEMPWEKACEADMKKLCQAEMKGDVRPCLAEHEKELSKQCSGRFSAAGFRVAQACEDDINRLCQEAAVKGTLAQCMNAKQAQLSAKCKKALTAAAPKKSAPDAEGAEGTAPAPKAKAKAKTKKAKEAK